MTLSLFGRTGLSGLPLRLAALAALAMALFTCLATLPANAQSSLKRVVVTLEDVDRDAEIEDLIDALRGYRYRLVRIEEDRPVVVLDVSAKALKVLRRLDFIVSIRSGNGGGDGVDRPAPLPSFVVTIREDYDFDEAVSQVRDVVTSMSGKVTGVDRASGTVIVAMRERDIGSLSTLQAVESVVAGNRPPRPGTSGDTITPLPEGEDQPRRRNGNEEAGLGARQRIIVQFDGNRREKEIRRILAALDGYNYKVYARFEVTPAIGLEVDKRALKRVLSLPGVKVQLDMPASPQ
jgi:hypothetical protein